MERLAQAGAAVVLLLVAASAPVMGWAAAEYQGRKLYGVLEGDWLFLFALIAGASCVWTAAQVLRGRDEPER